MQVLLQLICPASHPPAAPPSDAGPASPPLLEPELLPLPDDPELVPLPDDPELVPLPDDPELVPLPDGPELLPLPEDAEVTLVDPELSPVVESGPPASPSFRSPRLAVSRSASQPSRRDIAATAPATTQTAALRFRARPITSFLPPRARRHLP
jgi:hypothetical protein